MSGYLAWTVPRACPHPSPPPEGEGAIRGNGTRCCPDPGFAPSPSGGGLGWGHACHKPEFKTLMNCIKPMSHGWNAPYKPKARPLIHPRPSPQH
jgi:hypothetical protein